MTKVDEMCEWVRDDKRLVFHSGTVERLVTRAAHATGLTEMCILPFVSYTYQHTVNPAIDRLALSTMLSLLRVVTDFIDTQKR